MNMGAIGTEVRQERGAVLCMADVQLARRLTAEVKRSAKPGSIFTVSTLALLYEQVQRSVPHVIILADDILNDAPLTETLYRLSQAAPVIFLAAQERQTEIAKIVAECDVEFVARVGDFIPLAASLIERKSRRLVKESVYETGLASGEMPEDMAEIFRHEFNNPLTGILGNAELVLSHGDRLSRTDTPAPSNDRGPCRCVCAKRYDDLAMLRATAIKQDAHERSLL